jgi:ATP-binding cassette subfamily B protein
MQQPIPLKVWQYAWHIYRFLPWRFFFLFLIISSGWLLFIALGLLPSQFFDTLTGVNPSPLGIWGVIALLGGFEMARALTNFGWSVVGVATAYRVRALLQRNLLQRILDAPAGRALPFSAGEAANRFRDDVNSVSWLLASWQSFLGACLFALIGLIMMARISLPITLLVFLPLVVIIIVANRLRPQIEANRTRSRQATGDTTGALGELFHSVQAIKVARAEERMVGYFAGISEQRQRASLQEILFNNSLDALFGCTTEIGMSLILLFTASAMRAGTFTVGSFVLFVFFLDYVPGIIGEIGNLIPQYRQTGIAFSRLDALMHGAPPEQLVRHHRHLIQDEQVASVERIVSSAEPLRALEVHNLSYTHAGSQQGIKQISFRLERGKCLVITGRIGSGKTTLLRTVLGLLPKEEGQISWNGEPVNDPATFFVPPHSAYTAQVPRLFSETLRNNILLGLSEQDVDVAGALHSAVLEAEFPTLDIVLGPRGMRLSGGQVQRTAAARMFVRTAELLVLDDLSSALDVNTENSLWQRLFVDGHPALLIVSHRPEALRRADHILVLRDGEVEAEGTLAELLPKNEEIRSIWYGTDTPS